MERTTPIKKLPVQITTKGTVMSWDPSMTAWGWAILSFEGDVIAVGCIKTAPENKKARIRKSDDRCRRITEINMQLLELIRKYDVRLIVSEIQHGSQSAVAATMLGITIGMTQTLSDCLDISIETWSEGDAKLNLLGRRSATKEDTIRAVSDRYVVPWKKVKYHDEAVADAMAIFHVARRQSNTLKLLRK